VKHKDGTYFCSRFDARLFEHSVPLPNCKVATGEVAAVSLKDLRAGNDGTME